jgi:hypothetical protein
MGQPLTKHCTGFALTTQVSDDYCEVVDTPSVNHAAGNTVCTTALTMRSGGVDPKRVNISPTRHRAAHQQKKRQRDPDTTTATATATATPTATTTATATATATTNATTNAIITDPTRTNYGVLLPASRMAQLAPGVQPSSAGRRSRKSAGGRGGGSGGKGGNTPDPASSTLGRSSNPAPLPCPITIPG